uniref:Uncharacterized protein n=1 Tax=Pseudo-nitzschia australis TaxID=44445 RepID=A0A7S4AGV3_9STRA|mmetsp:Transcript_20794/g.45258  ORF Transcript_20794/g.45258 Transcript_20794/m.45258 type:complete len:121 (-) Transcript_20794:222-584(-)
MGIKLVCIALCDSGGRRAVLPDVVLASIERIRVVHTVQVLGYVRSTERNGAQPGQYAQAPYRTFQRLLRAGFLLFLFVSSDAVQCNAASKKVGCKQKATQRNGKGPSFLLVVLLTMPCNG